MQNRLASKENKPCKFNWLILVEFLSFSPTPSVNDIKKHRLPVEKPSSSVDTKITFIRGGLSYVQQSAEKESLSDGQNFQLSFSFLTDNRLSLVYFFPKTVTLLTLAQAESTVPPAASLRHSSSSLLFRFVAFQLRHDDMKFIAASFFSLQPLMRSSKEKKAKEKRSHYSVID